MLFDGIKLVEGSEVQNLVVDSGTSFPINPNVGELFVRTDGANKGLYLYQDTGWVTLSSGGTGGGTGGGLQLVTQLPETASSGDAVLFIENGVEQLYVYDSQAATWVRQLNEKTDVTVGRGEQFPTVAAEGELFLKITDGYAQPYIAHIDTYTSELYWSRLVEAGELAFLDCGSITDPVSAE